MYWVFYEVARIRVLLDVLTHFDIWAAAMRPWRYLACLQLCRRGLATESPTSPAWLEQLSDLNWRRPLRVSYGVLHCGSHLLVREQHAGRAYATSNTGHDSIGLINRCRDGIEGSCQFWRSRRRVRSVLSPAESLHWLPLASDRCLRESAKIVSYQTIGFHRHK